MNHLSCKEGITSSVPGFYNPSDFQLWSNLHTTLTVVGTFNTKKHTNTHEHTQTAHVASDLSVPCLLMPHISDDMIIYSFIVVDRKF